jgi:hypothetical protein
MVRDRRDRSPTIRPRPWLAALKRLQDESVSPEQTDRESITRVTPYTDKTDESPADDAVDVRWRTVVLRAIIPAHGPIWPPRIRTTPLCDTPGYCSLCGDELPIDPVPRFRRCAACVRALWLAMNELREGVVAEDEFTRADAP